MKHRYIYQDESNECGVICLYNIIKYYKGNISIVKLKKMLKVNKNGTSVYDIVNVSNLLGLKANAYMCSIDNIKKGMLPLIAHVRVSKKYDHFVIIDSIKKNDICIVDPIRGKIKMKKNEFLNEWTNIIITLKKTNVLINEKDKKKYNFIKSIIQPNLKIICFFVLLTLLCTILSLINSFYLSLIYNNYSFLITFLFIIFVLIKLLLDYIRCKIVIKFDKKFDFKITNYIYNKILSLPLKYHHSRPVGDIVSRINDLSSLKELINAICFSFTTDIIYVILILICIFLINKKIFLLLFIFTFIYFLVYLLYKNKIYKESFKLKEKTSYVNSYLIESIKGIDTIKKFGIENEKETEFKIKYNNFLLENSKYKKLLLNLDLILGFIFDLTSVVILYFGIKLVQNNVLSFLNLIIINYLLYYYFGSLNKIASLFNMNLNSKNAVKRLKRFLIEEEDALECTHDFLINSHIQFKNIFLNFSNYNLNGLNFIINKNESVFIKGKSGVGKSTIFKILTKSYDDYKGEVLIDGINIKKLSVKNIKNNILYVSQDEIIFTDTILNNIKLFKSVTDEELNKVVRITGIDKMLKDKNITLNYLLEENGHNLSGGERQRILLARALLFKKRVLILDETTSSLDDLSEREIIKNIITEYTNTLILISHRDTCCDLFDKVIKI